MHTTSSLQSMETHGIHPVRVRAALSEARWLFTTWYGILILLLLLLLCVVLV